MTDAVLYARFSPRRGGDDSISAQMKDLHVWCEKNDANPVLCCYDQSISGTVRFRNRRGLSQALDRLDKGMYFVVRNLNRMARSVGAALEIEDEIYEDRKSKIVSIEDGGLLDVSPTGNLTRVVLYAVAEHQRVESNTRTSRRMKQMQADGRAMGGQAPFGFKRCGDELVPNDEEAAILEHIVDFRHDGLGCRRIAAELHYLGMTTRKGTAWSASAVQHLIKKHFPELVFGDDQDAR